MWIRVSFAAAILLEPQPDPVGLAICRAGADARLVLAPAPRCCRTFSAARLLCGEIPSGTAPLVSLPLAVPFPAQCAFSECLIFGVQSTGTHKNYVRISPGVSSVLANRRA